MRLDFVCGDEVYGACTELREYLEDHDQAYVLRVPSSFRLILAAGLTLTCKQAAARLGSRRGWEIRSAGTGSKGHRRYAWAWLATASPAHHLLIRRHLESGELAFHYCYLPDGQPASPSRPVRAAGLRWPVGPQLPEPTLPTACGENRIAAVAASAAAVGSRYAR